MTVEAPCGACSGTGKAQPQGAAVNHIAHCPVCHCQFTCGTAPPQGGGEAVLFLGRHLTIPDIAREYEARVNAACMLLNERDELRAERDSERDAARNELNAARKEIARLRGELTAARYHGIGLP